MTDSGDKTTESTNSYDVLDDPLFLGNSDQPMLQLVGYLFNGLNFLQWKRDVYLALVSKNKEGFIDGSIKKPPKTEKKHHQWVRCDLLVMKWILNFMTTPIQETLRYATSSKALWTEILDRYGQCNTVEVYQLQKELVDISQGGSSLVDYYSKLKNTWESIDTIDPIPTCTCGALDSCTCSMLKRIVDRDSQSKLIQFMMGLNHQYDSVKTTVLSMDPLPSLSKAFSLLQNIEHQKQITDAVEVLAEANAYACSHQSDDAPSGSKKPKYTNSVDSEDVKKCNYCHHLGHTKDECFKLKECSHCGRKGHAKETCFRLRNNSFNRFGRGKGRTRSDSYNRQRGAYNADVLPYHTDTDFSPLDESPVYSNSNSAGVSSQLQPLLAADDPQMTGLVDTVMQKVLQALSDKPSPSSLSSANFAGPYK